MIWRVPGIGGRRLICANQCYFARVATGTYAAQGRSQRLIERRATMGKPVPLAVWDRRDNQVHTDWMDDGKSHYETQPQRSPLQWLESQPAYDWFYAALQNSR